MPTNHQRASARACAIRRLRDLSRALQNQHIEALQRDREKHQQTLRLEHCGIYLDLSKNLVSPAVISALEELFDACHTSDRLRALYAGEAVNTTEQRPALHSALRAAVCGHAAPHAETIRENYQAIAAVAQRLYHGKQPGHTGKPIRDLVNLGIGGSDLGPRMATSALADSRDGKTNVHFVSSLDNSELNKTLAHLAPETTLFLVSSKSFSTEETLFNARQAIAWFRDRGGQQRLDGHFMAITGNAEGAARLGIESKDVFSVPTWVGGRYSLWSAIGLPLMAAIGPTRFEQMLAGAYDMDRHAVHADFANNMPALMAGLEFWNSSVLGYHSLAVIPYSYPLRMLPAYLQQLVMESNGKSRLLDGSPSQLSTAPLLWGTAGTEGQHSYHQWLHQGTQVTPVDFILPYGNSECDSQRRLACHCIAQSKALMEGKSETDAFAELVASGMNIDEARALAPHKAMPGNRPSNTLILDGLTPRNLGALLALYEHKTFFTSVLWEINAFDQWGVELGKQLSSTVMTQLTASEPPSLDTSSNALITRIRSGAPE